MSVTTLVNEDIPKVVLKNTHNKYNIGDKVYIYNINMNTPLVIEFMINGVIQNGETFFYTTSPEKNIWINEEFLFKSRREAYRSLVAQAELEMNKPDLK